MRPALVHVLLLEANGLLRSTTASHLRDLGYAHITTASKFSEGRALLEQQRFDVILCSQEFEGQEPDGHAQSGHLILEELRREQGLPHSTVFLLMADRAAYQEVVEAAESALDGLLVRPFTAQALADKLAWALERKQALAELLKALDAGQGEQALLLALRHHNQEGPYRQYCGRVAAELLLQLGQPHQAKALFEKLDHEGAQAWARLGVARCWFEAGALMPAAAALEAMLDGDPAQADAHEWLGRLRLAQCDFGAALHSYSQAAQLTPGCLLRQQHTGALAFFQGNAQQALAHLTQALELGMRGTAPSSRSFDALSLVLLALLRFDKDDHAGVAKLMRSLQAMATRASADARLQRLLAATQVLDQAAQGAKQARPAMQALAHSAQDEHFDLEAATLLLALAWRLPQAFESPKAYETLVRSVALRFASSKALGELLVAAAGRSHPATGIIRNAHQQQAQLGLDAKAVASRLGHLAGLSRAGRAAGALHLRGVARGSNPHLSAAKAANTKGAVRSMAVAANSP